MSDSIVIFVPFIVCLLLAGAHDPLTRNFWKYWEE